MFRGAIYSPVSSLPSVQLAREEWLFFYMRHLQPVGLFWIRRLRGPPPNQIPNPLIWGGFMKFFVKT